VSIGAFCAATEDIARDALEQRLLAGIGWRKKENGADQSVRRAQAYGARFVKVAGRDTSSRPPA